MGICCDATCLTMRYILCCEKFLCPYTVMCMVVFYIKVVAGRWDAYPKIKEGGGYASLIT
mgnify:CR=1